jgi:acetyltransferase
MDEKEAIATAETIGYPVAMKPFSMDASCFEKIDDIEPGLRTPADVHYALARRMAENNTPPDDQSFPGVILQPYITRPEYKLIFAIKKDPQFGPVLLFGMGGCCRWCSTNPVWGYRP